MTVNFSPPINAYIPASPAFGKVENNDKKPNGLASALLGAGGTSFWLGTYTPIPAPPKEARMQMSLSTESGDHVFVNYLIWDKDQERFRRQDIHYATSNGLINTNEFKERGGLVQDVHDGEILSGGVIVDQLRKRLILPSGYLVDGPTGNIMNKSGEVIKKFQEDKHPDAAGNIANDQLTNSSISNTVQKGNSNTVPYTSYSPTYSPPIYSANSGYAIAPSNSYSNPYRAPQPPNYSYIG